MSNHQNSSAIVIPADEKGKEVVDEAFVASFASMAANLTHGRQATVVREAKRRPNGQTMPKGKQVVEVTKTVQQVEEEKAAEYRQRALERRERLGNKSCHCSHTLLKKAKIACLRCEQEAERLRYLYRLANTGSETECYCEILDQHLPEKDRKAACRLHAKEHAKKIERRRKAEAWRRKKAELAAKRERILELAAKLPRTKAQKAAGEFTITEEEADELTLLLGEKTCRCNLLPESVSCPKCWKRHVRTLEEERIAAEKEDAWKGHDYRRPVKKGKGKKGRKSPKPKTQQKPEVEAEVAETIAA